MAEQPHEDHRDSDSEYYIVSNVGIAKQQGA